LCGCVTSITADAEPSEVFQHAANLGLEFVMPDNRQWSTHKREEILIVITFMLVASCVEILLTLGASFAHYL
jgi:hypothetical protein